MNQYLIGWVSILIYPICYISDIEFFLYLNIFSLINFLLICLIVVGLKFHLVLVTSAHYCCSIRHLLVLVRHLIITLKLCFPKIFSRKWCQRLNVEKTNRFSLNILYGSKKLHDIIKSDKQRGIKFTSNQSDLIILFSWGLSECFIIAFISKRKRFFDAF